MSVGSSSILRQDEGPVIFHDTEQQWSLFLELTSPFNASAIWSTQV
jgi:hypothetical protein